MAAKKRPGITHLLCLSDLHCGSTHALCPPDFPLADDGYLGQTKRQVWIWDQWQAFIKLSLSRLQGKRWGLLQPRTPSTDSASRGARVPPLIADGGVGGVYPLARIAAAMANPPGYLGV